MDGFHSASRRISAATMVVVALGSGISVALAGMRIDLRPDPPIPPGGYEPNAIVDIRVYYVDTGNPQGNILFRGLFLDFNDSPPWGGTPGTFTYLGDNPAPSHPGDDLYFTWVQSFGIGTWPLLPNPAWIYPLATPQPLFQITLPDNGEVYAGHIYVNLGSAGGTLDVMNDDVADPSFGARADFGFGGPNDPVTTWRAYTGELTGGVLDLPVVPEPASAVLVGIGLVCVTWARRERGRWRNGGSYGGPGLRSNAPTGHRLTAQGWLDASRVYPGSTAGPAATLSGLWRFDVRAPRVAASRQPWAGGRNTFGVVRGSASSLVTRAPHRNSAPSPPRSCARCAGVLRPLCRDNLLQPVCSIALLTLSRARRKTL